MTKGFFFEGDVKDEAWKKEWKGMPEFMQEDVSPFKSIMVNFENKQDMEAFAKLIGQGITTKTQSIYYPKAKIDGIMNKRYVDTMKKKKETMRKVKDES